MPAAVGRAAGSGGVPAAAQGVRAARCRSCPRPRSTIGAAARESYVAEGTITLDDEPPPVKPVGPSAKALTTPKKPADGTLILTPPPMPPSRPASTPVALSVPPAKPPAPATPPRPTVPPAVRLKERIQGICGPAFEINVTNRGKNYLQLDVTGGSGADGQRLMERITPVLKSQEFSSFEINVDIVITGK